MTFAARVMGQYRVEALSSPLVKALQDWIYLEKTEPLISLYKSKPKLFQDLDKGLRYKTLYRVIGLHVRDLKEFIEKGTLPNEGLLESWSASLKGLQSFSHRASSMDQLVVIFKRVVPASERVVCLACLPKDSKIRKSYDSTMDDEREVIVKRTPLKKEWILRVIEPDEDVARRDSALTSEQLRSRLAQV